MEHLIWNDFNETKYDEMVNAIHSHDDMKFEYFALQFAGENMSSFQLEINPRAFGSDKWAVDVVLYDKTAEDYDNNSFIGYYEDAIPSFSEFKKAVENLALDCIEKQDDKSIQADFDYKLLGRLQQDCKYVLDICMGENGLSLESSEKHLWAKSPKEQIDKMQELYDSLPVKPEWITQDEINTYASRFEAAGANMQERVSVSQLASDIEQVMFERGEYEYAFKGRPIQIDPDIAPTSNPSDEIRNRVTSNIESDIVSSVGKAALFNYLAHEMDVMDEADETLKLVEKCADVLGHKEIEDIYTLYGTSPEMDSLVDSDNWTDRSNAARHGYALDRLMNDSEYKVRADVANTGYKLDTFLYDPHEYVRELATEKLVRENKHDTIQLSDDVRVSFSVEKENNDGIATEVGIQIYNNNDDQLTEAYNVPANELPKILDDIKATNGDLQKLADIEYIGDSKDDKYAVTAFYGGDYKGCANSLETNEWSEVEDFSHENAMDGLYIEIKNVENGKTIHIDPDVYSQTFDGEFPFKASDLENSELIHDDGQEGRYTIYATSANRYDYNNLYSSLSTDNWNDVKDFSERYLGQNCNIEIHNNDTNKSVSVSPAEYKQANNTLPYNETLTSKSKADIER